MGRLVRTTMPDGSFDQTTYGPDGILTRTDRGGATTTYTYGVFGRRASETNPNSETISYEHGLSGRMAALVDANNSRTEWSYDTEGRLTTKTYADASQYTYTYDAGGHLATRTDAKGKTTTYTHDARGNPLAVDYPDDTDIAYTYDLLGRRTGATDAAGTTTFAYNIATGQVASVDGPFATDTVTFTHDASGQRLASALDGTAVATYAYDIQGRLATVTGAPGTFAYSYAANSGTVAGISRPGDIATARTFDTLGRLTEVAHSRPGQAPAATIAGFAYTLDDHDRRTRIDLAHGGGWDYTYDNAGQVTGGTRTGTTVGQTAGTLVTYRYQYDAMGNPQQRTEDAGVSSYTYNNLNQLATGDWAGTLSAFGWTRTEGLASLTVADGAQTVPATVLEPGEWTAKTLAANAGTNTYTVTRTATDATTATAATSVVRPADQTAYTHDANGNMLANGGWTYTWNDENRLATATRADGLQKLEFVYDFQGRRRIKRAYSRPTGNDPFALAKTTLFVYDGWLLLQERATDHVAATTTARTYLHGLDLSDQLGGEGMDANATAGGIGGMLAVTTSRSDSAIASSLLYLYDGNGNVAALVDPVTTESAAAYEYSPFGKTLVAHGPLADANPFRFSAKYTDTETGLVYYGYRYYESELGRWINRDPVGEVGGVNVYVFIENDAMENTDYLGLRSVKSIQCIVGAPIKGKLNPTTKERVREYQRLLMLGGCLAEGEDDGVWGGKTETAHGKCKGKRFNVQADLTYYCACKECCGADAAGVCADGTKFSEGVIAAPRSIPFGSTVTYTVRGKTYTRTVHDRGGLIKVEAEFCKLDVGMESHEECIKIGHDELTVELKMGTHKNPFNGKDCDKY